MKNLQLIKSINDVRYAKVNLYRNPKDDTYYVRLKKLFQSLHKAEKLKRLLDRRISNPNLYYVSITTYSLKEVKQFCSSFHQMKILMPYPEEDLTKELKNRMDFDRPFTNKEMTFMLYDLINGMAHLQKLGFVHGSFSPDFVARTTTGYAVMENPVLNHFRVLNLKEKVDWYLSPEAYHSALKWKPFGKDFSINKSDVFSAGLVVLKCGLFRQIHSVYQKDKFNTAILGEMIKEFEGNFPDNNLLISTVKKMLELRESDRPDFLEIMDKLPAYKIVRNYFKENPQEESKAVRRDSGYISMGSGSKRRKSNSSSKCSGQFANKISLVKDSRRSGKSSRCGSLNNLSASNRKRKRTNRIGGSSRKKRANSTMKVKKENRNPNFLDGSKDAGDNFDPDLSRVNDIEKRVRESKESFNSNRKIRMRASKESVLSGQKPGMFDSKNAPVRPDHDAVPPIPSAPKAEFHSTHEQSREKEIFSQEMDPFMQNYTKKIKVQANEFKVPHPVIPPIPGRINMIGRQLTNKLPMNQKKKNMKQLNLVNQILSQTAQPHPGEPNQQPIEEPLNQMTSHLPTKAITRKTVLVPPNPPSQPITQKPSQVPRYPSQEQMIQHPMTPMNLPLNQYPNQIPQQQPQSIQPYHHQHQQQHQQHQQHQQQHQQPYQNPNYQVQNQPPQPQQNQPPQPQHHQPAHPPQYQGPNQLSHYLSNPNLVSQQTLPRNQFRQPLFAKESPKKPNKNAIGVQNNQQIISPVRKVTSPGSNRVEFNDTISTIKSNYVDHNALFHPRPYYTSFTKNPSTRSNHNTSYNSPARLNTQMSRNNLARPPKPNFKSQRLNPNHNLTPYSRRGNRSVAKGSPASYRRTSSLKADNKHHSSMGKIPRRGSYQVPKPNPQIRRMNSYSCDKRMPGFNNQSFQSTNKQFYPVPRAQSIEKMPRINQQASIEKIRSVSPITMKKYESDRGSNRSIRTPIRISSSRKNINGLPEVSQGVATPITIKKGVTLSNSRKTQSCARKFVQSHSTMKPNFESKSKLSSNFYQSQMSYPKSLLSKYLQSPSKVTNPENCGAHLNSSCKKYKIKFNDIWNQTSEYMFTEQGTKLAKIIQKSESGEDVVKWIALRPSNSKKSMHQGEQSQLISQRNNSFKKYTLRSSDKKKRDFSNKTSRRVEKPHVSTTSPKAEYGVKSAEKNTIHLNYEKFLKQRKTSQASLKNPTPFKNTASTAKQNQDMVYQTQKSPYFVNFPYSNPRFDSNKSSAKKPKVSPNKYRKGSQECVTRPGSNHNLISNSPSPMILSPMRRVEKLVCQTAKDVQVPFPVEPHKENSINNLNKGSNLSGKTSGIKSFSKFDPYNLMGSVSKTPNQASMAHISSYQNVISLKSPNSPISRQNFLPEFPNMSKYTNNNTNVNYFSDLRHMSHENTQSEIELEPDMNEKNYKKIDNISPKIVIEASYHPESNNDNPIKLMEYKDKGHKSPVQTTRFYAKDIR